MTPLVRVTWRARAVPLHPVVAMARGDAALALAARIECASELERAEWRAASAPGCVVVAGSGLPWVDGVVYLGRVPGCGLHVPTTLEPSVPAQLLEAALRRRFPDEPLPLAALDDGTVLSLGRLA